MKLVSGTVKLAKISVAREVIGPRAEPTNVLLNRHSFNNDLILIFIPIDWYNSQPTSEKLCLAMESS